MDKKLLEKYLLNQCTEEEVQIIQRWLASSGENKKTFQLLKSAWEASNPDIPDEQADFDHILNNILLKIQDSHQAPARESKVFAMQPALKIAASVALFVVAGILLFFLIRQHSNSTIAYTTGYGDTKIVVLPDQSTVVLNANSTITYNTNWNESSQREIWLEGEAYFEVKKVQQTVDEQVLQKKFIVYTDDIEVEVLGTAFNVNTRRDITKVVLASGKVKINSISSDYEPLFMEPGDMVEYSSSTNQIMIKEVDPEVYTSWKQNQLSFVAASLLEVAKTLEDNFGYEVIFKSDDIKDLSFTGSASTKDINTFLSDLSKIFNLKIEMHENKIIIENKEQ